MTQSEEQVPALESIKHFAQHCARKHHWKVTSKGPKCVKSPLRLAHLSEHMTPGKQSIGLSPIAPGSSNTRIAVLDIDDHSGKAGWGAIEDALNRLVPVLLERHMRPNIFRSSGGKGAHIYLLWDKPQDAFSIRESLKETLTLAGFVAGTKGVLEGEIEVFPKQDSVARDGFGSMFVLPFSKESTPINSTTLDLEDLDTAEAVEYWLDSEPVHKREKPEVEKSTPIGDVDLQDLEAALNKIPNSGEDELDYDTWRNVIFAIHHATGGAQIGEDLAIGFSRRSDKFDIDFFNERVWPYIRSDSENAITAATIFSLAREYETPEDLMAAFADLPKEEVKKSDEKSKYRVESAFNFSQGEFPGWLIKGVLPQTELNVMYGVSGAGKSFVALDLSAAIARGEEWRGRRVRKGKVVYVCAEGVGGFRQRVKAYMMQNEIKADGFDLGVLAATPNFLQTNDVREVIKAIKAFGKVDLIVVDTLAQVMPGGNENSSEDMGLAVNNCRGLHRATGATVLVVHHAGKDTSKGARGWSGLRAAADSELEIVQAEGQRQIRVRKMKDGLDGGAYPFELKEITIGIDSDGDSVESCTVEHLPDAELETNMNKLKGAWEQAAYSALLNLQGLESDDIPLGELAEAVCKRRDVELNYRTRGAITRAVDKLEQKGYVAISDDGRARLIAWAKVPAEMAGEDRVAESYSEPDKKRRDFSWRNALLGVLDEWDGTFTEAEVVATAIKRRKRLGDVPSKTGDAYTLNVALQLDKLIEEGAVVVQDGRVFGGKAPPADKLAEGLV